MTSREPKLVSWKALCLTKKLEWSAEYRDYNYGDYGDRDFDYGDFYDKNDDSGDYDYSWK